MRMTTALWFSRPILIRAPLTPRTSHILLKRATMSPRSGL
uniref:Uncharacterized protein n=1 Tax=Anguilla anguilla TaxID=7936 RepID=A0A0E9VZC6_ANGAN